jgi:hypothetical protein
MQSFISLVVSLLAVLNFATACVHLYGSYNDEHVFREGKVIDNGVQTCDCRSDMTTEPAWCECIDGYHAFITRDLTTFAYDTPHSKDMRLHIDTWYITDNTCGWDEWAWGC